MVARNNVETYGQNKTLAAAATALALLAAGSACTASSVRTPGAPAPNAEASVPPSLAAFVPPGAPAEDVRYFKEWPSPNGGLYNTRVASSSISAGNVAKLANAWTLPLTATGLTGRDVANPVIADGVVYLQDGDSNVMAVSDATGRVRWKHTFSSQDYGPNGVTLAYGVAYVPVVDLGTTYSGPTVVTGAANFQAATGEMVALDVATGRQLWATKLPQMPLGGATVAGDLVFTTTFTGELAALSRADGSIVWTSSLPAGSNSTLAIAGDTLLAGAGLPLSSSQQPALVAYRLS